MKRSRKVMIKVARERQKVRNIGSQIGLEEIIALMPIPAISPLIHTAKA